MQKEIIYKFQILLFSDSDKLIERSDYDHWEFPSDEKIMNAITEHGADYAEILRIYVVDEIPFTD